MWDFSQTWYLVVSLFYSAQNAVCEMGSLEILMWFAEVTTQSLGDVINKTIDLFVTLHFACIAAFLDGGGNCVG